METNQWIDVPRSARVSNLVQKTLFVVIISAFLTAVAYEAGVPAQIVSIVCIVLLILLSSSLYFFRSDTVQRFMLTDKTLVFVSEKGATSEIPFDELSQIKLVPSAITKSYVTVMIKTKARKTQEEYYHQPIGKDRLPIKDALKAVGVIAAGASFKTGNAVMSGQKLMGDRPDIRFWVGSKISEDVKNYISSRILS